MVCLYGTYRRNARECECRALASFFKFHKLRETHTASLRNPAGGGCLNFFSEVVAEALGEAEWLFSLVGAVQAILGPSPLFHVLVTLRSQFRLG